MAMKRWVPWFVGLGFASSAMAGPLHESYQRVLTDEPAVVRALAELDRQRAREAMAGSRLLPQLDLQMSESRIEQNTLGSSTEFDGQTHRLTASQALVDAEGWARRTRETALVEESGYRNASIRDNLALSLVERYFGVIRARSRRDVLLDLVSHLETRLAQASALVKAGQLSVLDQVRVESRLAERQSELASSERGLAEALAALNQLDPQWRPEVATAPTAISMQWPALPDQDTLIATAIEINPELLGLEARIRAEDAGLDAVSRRRIPTIRIEASYEDSNIGSNNRQISNTETTIFGLSLSMPLYRGGGLGHEKDEQTALLRAIEMDYQAARRALERRIASAVAQFRQGRVGLDVENAYVAAQLRAERVLEQALEKGAVSQSEYLDALDAVANARISRDEVLFSGLTGWLSARVAAGMFDADDLSEIDTALADFLK